ncbi:MAG: hypothetical protein AAFV53_17510 [Myxococcota bacterium]
MPISPMKLAADDERSIGLSQNPTAVLSRLFTRVAEDTVELKMWLVAILGEDTGAAIVQAADNSEQRMSEAVESMQRRGYLGSAFFDTLGGMYANSEHHASIQTARDAFEQKTPQWRTTLTTLLLQLFTDVTIDENRYLDSFLAEHFAWDQDVLRSISAASRGQLDTFAFKVAGALDRRGHLDQEPFYRSVHSNVSPYLQPIVLHIWWLHQQRRKNGW